MRILFLLFASLLMCSIVGCGQDPEVGSGAIASAPLRSGEWDTLSQHDKNQKILETALVDLDVDVRLSCKNWIHKVVKDATNESVVIPQNNENGDGWNEDTTGRLYGWGAAFKSSTSIMTATPGAIVQMQWKDGEGAPYPHNRHTAIVLSVSDPHVVPHVVFIESNYDTTPKVEDGPTYVRIRCEPATEFHRKVESFTIYYIG